MLSVPNQSSVLYFCLKDLECLQNDGELGDNVVNSLPRSAMPMSGDIYVYILLYIILFLFLMNCVHVF